MSELTVAKLRLANLLFNHPVLHHLLWKSTLQNLDPLPIDEPAVSISYDSAPHSYNVQQLYTGDPKNLHILTGSNKDKNTNFYVDVLIDSCILVLIGKKWQKEHATWWQAMLQLWPLGESSQRWQGENMILVCVTSLKPADVQSDWFPVLAKVLFNTQIKITVACEEGPISRFPDTRPQRARRGRLQSFATGGRGGDSHTLEPDQHGHARNIGRVYVDTTTFNCKAPVNALTATLVAMKARGDLQAMAKVFFFGPSQIAQEIRIFGLAPAIGVEATTYLLGCIFDALEKKSYDINQPELVLAATHLLVAHIGRKDYHACLEQAIPGMRGYVAERLVSLIKIIYASDPMANFPVYVKMAALRDGIVYGAMRAYAHDLDAHNTAHVAALEAFANAATTLASSAADGAPVIGTSVSGGLGAIGGLVQWAINFRAGALWSKGELDTAIAARYDVEVTGPAKAGVMPLLKMDAGLKQDPQLSPANLKIIQDVYLVNIGIIITFAVNGSVTSRLSTLRRTIKAL